MATDLDRSPGATFEYIYNGPTQGWQKVFTGITPILSTVEINPSDANQMALRINQLGYGNVPPTGSIEVGFNEIFVDDYTPTNVAKATATFLTLRGDVVSNWGSANTLTEKVCGNFEVRVFKSPTGSPGPHQPVALAATSRVASGVGPCPTIDLFAANFNALTGSPVNSLIGNEYDLTVSAGGSCHFKWGTNVATNGAAGTDGNDTAYLAGGDAIAKWATGYSWFTNTISGTILGPYAGTAVLSCVNGIDFSTATFSGSQIKLAMGTNLKNAANDAAAAALGVVVGAIYRNGSVLMVRVA